MERDKGTEAVGGSQPYKKMSSRVSIRVGGRGWLTITNMYYGEDSKGLALWRRGRADVRPGWRLGISMARTAKRKGNRVERSRERRRNAQGALNLGERGVSEFQFGESGVLKFRVSKRQGGMLTINQTAKRLRCWEPGRPAWGMKVGIWPNVAGWESAPGCGITQDCDVKLST